MDGKVLLEAVEALVKIKKVDRNMVFDALEMVLLTAYKKESGSNAKASVSLNRETGEYKIYEEIDQNALSIFVGDGINDAPVLKRADIGISMGNVGSEVAIEASDIVIMNDDLNKIPQAINISKYTKKIIKQNLIFAFLTKIIILLLSVFGLATMYLAVFADTGVTLITIINTLRIKNKFEK